MKAQVGTFNQEKVLVVKLCRWLLAALLLTNYLSVSCFQEAAGQGPSGGEGEKEAMHWSLLPQEAEGAKRINVKIGNLVIST